MTDTTLLEILLRHERRIIITGLVLITTLSWLYLLSGAGMAMDPLELTMFSLFPHLQVDGGMAEMDMETASWSLKHWSIVLLMWWIMMIAMMTPGVSPVVLLYARVLRHSQPQGQLTTIPTAAFGCGYLVAWLAFSVLATTLQWGLEQNDWLSMKMITSNGWLSGLLLISVGVYQLTPLKQACLKHCRSPAEFISRYMKTGKRGAFRMGIEHGGYCVGCCWLLMALLFVGGVMNLLWIAILVLFVLSEKVLPRGPAVSQITGFILITWGLTILFTLN